MDVQCFGSKEVTVLRHLSLDWNSNSMMKCWERGRLEWKRTFALINLGPSWLVVVLPEENLEKHGIKQWEKMRKKENWERTQVETR